jgi:manganese-dependent inorganic pyrophosphatase
MPIPDSILVIGHRNPDTDAIASAVGYAWLLNSLGGDKYVAGRTGQVNAQTAFALQRFEVESPALVTDIRPRVADITETLPSLRKGQTLLNACQSIARTRRPAPLLDEERRPVGLLSGAGLFANLADALSSTSVLALAKEFDRPAESAIDHTSTVLNANDFVRDVISQALRSEQDDFIVVDDEGRYIGLCRKSDLMSPPVRRLVLVDHNEPGQAVPGAEDADVIEVLDHHRLSALPTAVPIRFQIEPVGSCSTLVLERALELNKAFPASVAGLLLCGILSDTLVFRSPTATARDRVAARHLAQMANLIPENATDDQLTAAINSVGESLLGAGAGLGSRPADQIISTDIKFYEEGALRVGLAQTEVTSFSELNDRLPELRDALQKLLESQKLALALLMVTDVVRGNSRLVVVGQPRLLNALPYTHLSDALLDAPGVMSRKKQLLPVVLAALSEAQ